MAAGPQQWAEVAAIDDAPDFGLGDVELHLPFEVADYVDFYSSIEHATNLGRLFRPDVEPLLPNWRHLPVGYHGRAGTVVPSGTPIRRPRGQTKPPDADAPRFGPSRRLDIELELGFVIGLPSPLGEPVPVERALDHVFGLVLVNDWSARDIQAWEYVPLGPFLGKSFATSIGHWVLPLAGAAHRRVDAPPQEPEPLPYLREEPWAFDLPLEVELNGDVVSRTNAATCTGRRPAGRPPDRQRRVAAHRRPARLGHDLRARARPARLVHRADLERRRAARARRRLDPHVPRGRRRGGAARRGPRRGPRANHRLAAAELRLGVSPASPWRPPRSRPSARTAPARRPPARASRRAPAAPTAFSTPLARPTASGPQASSSATSASVAAPSSAAGATRLTSPIRSASVPSMSLEAMMSSFARPRPTSRGQARAAADVGDQADARLDEPADDGVARHDAQVAGQRQLGRAADAGAVDHADRRLRHLLGEVPGVEASTLRKARRLSGFSARSPSEPRSIPEENIGLAANHLAERFRKGRVRQLAEDRLHQPAVARLLRITVARSLERPYLAMSSNSPAQDRDADPVHAGDVDGGDIGVVSVGQSVDRNQRR